MYQVPAEAEISALEEWGELQLHQALVTL